jgi:hypothetical protein
MDKSQKKLLIIAVLVGMVLGLAFLIYTQFLKENDSIDIDENNDINFTVQEGNFTLTTKYIGDSEWEYQVTGTVPTPCHEVDINTQVMESFPEQVVVNVTVVTDSEEMCIQVIQDINKSGTFQASDEAKISLNVAELTKDQIGD